MHRYAGQSIVVNDLFPPIRQESPESEDDNDYDDDDEYETLQFSIETSGDEQQSHIQQDLSVLRKKRTQKSGFSDYSVASDTGFVKHTT